MSCERSARVKARAVTADALLVAQRLRERLAERDAAILHGVVRVHREITFTAQVQIHHGVLGEQSQHVVEERDAGAD
jgi:hypothetical protein